MITINEAFRKFLSEQEACLKPDAFLDCEDVILLYEEFLELNAEDYLSEEDRDLYARPVLTEKIKVTLMSLALSN